MLEIKDNLSFNIMDGSAVLAEAILYPLPRRIAQHPRWLAYTKMKDPNRRTLYVHRLWVRAKYRRCGLGTHVMRLVCAWASEQNITLVIRCHPFEPNGLGLRTLRRFYMNKFRFYPEGIRADILVRY